MSGFGTRRQQQAPPQVCQANHHQQPALDPFGSVFEPQSSLLGGGSYLDGLFTSEPAAAGPGSELEEPEVLAQMAEISAMEDPVARNFAITQMYETASTMMDQTLFPNAEEQGQTANWSTFAIWASNEAGRAIRGEGNWFMGMANAVGSDAQLEQSTNALADGNNTVFSEIAPAMAMFAHTFEGAESMDPEQFEAFAEWMRTEAPNVDADLGNEQLIQAFGQYHEAMFEEDPDRQQELMLLANANIGLHEQARLQPFIEDAMPWYARGAATAWGMNLHVPNSNDGSPVGLDFAHDYDALDLSEDVRERHWFWGHYTQDYPEALRSIDDPTVASEIDELSPGFWNPTVGAENWADYDDRMQFIAELFRSNQNNPNLHQVPFTDEQAQAHLDGE